MQGCDNAVQVLCVITMPVALIIESHQDATFTFISISILLCNFLSMALVFLPKVCYKRPSRVHGVTLMCKFNPLVPELFYSLPSN